MTTFKLLTLNLRHNADRWLERRPLVAAALAAHDADVIAFQEVWLPIQQADLLAADLAALTKSPTYAIRVQPKSGAEFDREGIALLSRLPVLESSSLELPVGNRVAQRVRVLKDGHAFDVVNTHLHHEPVFDESIREPQMRALLDWLNVSPDRNWLVCGDFNAQPQSSTVQRIAARFRSAYATLHGADPLTFPTPLVDYDYPPVALDYIFFDPARLTPTAAEVVAAQPAAHDARLYPSDHFGLTATFTT